MNVQGPAIGSLCSAFLSSLCCAGPLILGVLGVGAGATGQYVKALLPYRPLFIGLTVVLLALGFISVYRRKEACSTDSGCQKRNTATAQKIALWVATAGALLMILLPDLLAIGI